MRLLVQQLKSELSAACERTLCSSDRLVESARSLKKNPSSQQAKALFRGSTEGIRIGVTQVRVFFSTALCQGPTRSRLKKMISLIQVFTCWDDAAVRRITATGRLSMDKLEIMSGSQSMRSLVLCFRVNSSLLM